MVGKGQVVGPRFSALGCENPSSLSHDECSRIIEDVLGISKSGFSYR